MKTNGKFCSVGLMVCLFVVACGMSEKDKLQGSWLMTATVVGKTATRAEVRSEHKKDSSHILEIKDDGKVYTHNTATKKANSESGTWSLENDDLKIKDRSSEMKFHVESLEESFLKLKMEKIDTYYEFRKLTDDEKNKLLGR